MVKAVIFDFNGVLWWDTELQEKAWDEYAIKLRKRPFSDEEKFSHLHGVTNPDIIRYLVGHDLPKKEIDKLVQGKESLYRRLCLDQGENFKLSPGSEELLDYLNQKQIPITIATSSEKSNVDFFIKHLNLEKWFDKNKIVMDDSSFAGKPAPDIYLLAARKLNADPKDCVVIEDSKSGIESAFAAGIGKIIALGPKYKHKELSLLPGVDEAVENLGQVRI